MTRESVQLSEEDSDVRLRMSRTYLVQRLKVPLNTTTLGTVKPHHVFGNSALGLTQEMWDVLDPFFEMDYMGSAEYEFGAVPKTLSDLVRDRSQLVSSSFLVESKDIKPCWDREATDRRIRRSVIEDAKLKGQAVPRKKRTYLAPISPAMAYVICRKDQLEEVERRFRGLIKQGHYVDKDYSGKSYKQGARDSTLMDMAFDPPSAFLPESQSQKHLGEVGGWLELDNGFFMFSNEIMWKGVRRLFGVDVEVG
jgi:hypothetical protein